MKISELARQAGVNLQTIRYYERRGLLPAPARAANGYRVYDIGTLRHVKFIRHAQDLGFSLAEVRELLALRARNSTACTAVARRARAKIDLIDARIRSLRRVRNVLHKLVGACAARQSTPRCPLLEVIEEDGAALS